MAQKTKVKELVGRGLDSYHTKSLQQIDRIEKKNKEQNHKISILSNELDNDYLTKTEEGSVISLEHSKEGMVYLDELQGNTLVNYCTDGSKEMTLNGDIDVEGVSVTTTEGVDNGKVDVMCEGNTLVNLANIKSIYEGTNLTGYYADGTICETSLLKLNTAYTLIIEKEFLDGHNMNYTGFELGVGNSIHVTNSHPTMSNGSYSMSYNTDKYETKIVTVSFADFKGYKYLTIRPCRRNTAPVEGEVGKYKVKIIFLEGDWTNKEIPSYFTEMKSVGQDDENGHKIEILSSVGKENLIKDSDIYIEQSGTFKTFNSSYQNIIDKVQNKTITISVDIEVEDMIPRTDGKNRIGCELSVVYEDDTRGYHGIWYTGENFKGRQVRTFSITKKIKIIDYFGIYIQCAGKKHKIGRPKIEIGDTNTNWCPSSNDNLNGLQTFMNKKEILINKPLRGLPNGVKDQIVKIGGKYFIERKCGELTLDNNSSVSVPPNGSNWYKLSSGNLKVNILTFSIPKPSNCANTWGNGTNNNMAISDKFIIYPSTDASAFYDGEKIVFDSSDFKIGINKTKLTSQDIDGFKQWLQSNPVKVVYQLATPVYEPLEIEPTLNTYNDVTHISNNSIIPCNMKIQNSGYNAIIKPSTLYTVALDTNKSGTIGINLGGTKGTTTNNVATITTPATLTDDSLRLYGKGIKGSKVRLLEGDKTNWIPSHFEGMKSSFEDKIQEDGTYKMEILSNNENLFNKEKLTDGEFVLFNGKNCYKYVDGSKYFSYISHFKRNTQYNISFKAYKETDKQDRDYNIQIVYTDGTRQAQNGRHNLLLEFISLPNKTISKITGNWNWGDRVYIDLDEFLIKEKSEIVEYIPNKHNKIQFSSIEPLRSLPNGVKDKFIFKDNKLMIERNTRKSKVNNIENVSRSYDRWNNIVFAYKVEGLISVGESIRNVWSNLLPSRNIADLCNTLGKTGIASHNWVDRKLQIAIKGIDTVEKMKEWISKNNLEIVYQIEPTYEEIPFELQKIILEGYENGTLFFDTNIPPTSTVTYAGETPIVKSVRLNKTEVLSNTEDINDNIIPYLMDMDYRVVCLQLQSENTNNGISMARLFGGTYEMIKRDILSKRYSIDEYRYRLDAYLSANKITEEEYNKLGDMLNE